MATGTQTGAAQMVRIYCTLEGCDTDNTFAFTFDTPRALVTFLRKLGKGQLKRLPIARIASITEEA
jgi:hypothetical protein